MKHGETNRPGRLRMPRSRGAVTGFILIVLGAWGALIPFIGPLFHFAYTPDQAWTWTAARGWLEVLPGAIAIAGGVLLIISKNRANAMLGGWLATLAGAWFVVGGAFAPMLHLGSVGDPVAFTDRKRAVLEIAYFSGLGALMVFLGGVVLARLAVRLARDVRPVEAVKPAPAVPAGEPNYSGLEEPAREPSTDAVTTPRVETEPHHKIKMGFRRHREKAMAGRSDPQT
ncbi:hypothetical protein [Mycobacterium sp.]|uniref:hypothetical protein n=1 Tax=Mycobacterium sp. TaxID=1785 RepID=UPI002CDC2A38|nr:hypothetical protein [Mycobacterium sp.]HTQ21342.1 hypothetical protein [Mycobacterium sp.]